MKTKFLMTSAILAGFFFIGCVSDDFTDPANVDTKTGDAGKNVSSFSWSLTPTGSYYDKYLNAKTTSSAAGTGGFMVSSSKLYPLKDNSSSPVSYAASAGAEPDMATSSSNAFALISNDTYGGSWAAGKNSATFTAKFTFTENGDSIKVCRTAATTCLTVTATGDGAATVSMTAAANLPNNTNLGELTTNVYGKILDAGNAGLTIAVNTLVETGVTTSAYGSETTLTWTLSQASTEGSLKYSVGINGTTLTGGLAASDFVTALETAMGYNTGGSDPNCVGAGAGVACVAMQFADSDTSFNGITNGTPLMIRAGGTVPDALTASDFTLKGAGGATDGTVMTVYGPFEDVDDATGATQTLSTAAGSAANAEAIIQGAIKGLYTNFYKTVFGTTSAASGFGVTLTNGTTAGDDTLAELPSINSITVSR